jgi:hypothetical protein
MLCPALALAAAGCGGDGGGDFPWGGGGGNGNGMGGLPVDASIPDAGTDAQATGGIMGQLCELEDLLFVNDCAPTDLAGVRVALHGTATVTTAAADGRFALAPSDTDPAIIATGGGGAFRRVLTSVDVSASGQATGVVARAIREETWQTLVTTLGAGEAAGDAAIAVYVVDGAGAVFGAFIEASFGPEIFYDDAGGLGWRPEDVLGTGAAGAALLFQIPGATSEVGIIVRDDTRETFVGNIPVAPDSVTFVFAEL